MVTMIYIQKILELMILGVAYIFCYSNSTTRSSSGFHYLPSNLLPQLDDASIQNELMIAYIVIDNISNIDIHSEKEHKYSETIFDYSDSNDSKTIVQHTVKLEIGNSLSNWVNVSYNFELLVNTDWNENDTLEIFSPRTSGHGIHQILNPSDLRQWTRIRRSETDTLNGFKLWFIFKPAVPIDRLKYLNLAIYLRKFNLTFKSDKGFQKCSSYLNCKPKRPFRWIRSPPQTERYNYFMTYGQCSKNEGCRLSFQFPSTESCIEILYWHPDIRESSIVINRMSMILPIMQYQWWPDTYCAADFLYANDSNSADISVHIFSLSWQTICAMRLLPISKSFTKYEYLPSWASDDYHNYWQFYPSSIWSTVQLNKATLYMQSPVKTDSSELTDSFDESQPSSSLKSETKMYAYALSSLIKFHQNPHTDIWIEAHGNQSMSVYRCELAAVDSKYLIDQNWTHLTTQYPSQVDLNTNSDLRIIIRCHWYPEMLKFSMRLLIHSISVSDDCVHNAIQCQVTASVDCIPIGAHRSTCKCPNTYMSWTKGIGCVLKKSTQSYHVINNAERRSSKISLTNAENYMHLSSRHHSAIDFLTHSSNDSSKTSNGGGDEAGESKEDCGTIVCAPGLRKLCYAQNDTALCRCAPFNEKYHESFCSGVDICRLHECGPGSCQAKSKTSSDVTTISTPKREKRQDGEKEEDAEKVDSVEYECVCPPRTSGYLCGVKVPKRSKIMLYSFYGVLSTVAVLILCGAVFSVRSYMAEEEEGSEDTEDSESRTN